jgi:hypothetical protein
VAPHGRPVERGVVALRGAEEQVWWAPGPGTGCMIYSRSVAGCQVVLYAAVQTVWI